MKDRNDVILAFVIITVQERRANFQYRTLIDEWSMVSFTDKDDDNVFDIKGTIILCYGGVSISLGKHDLVQLLAIFCAK